ncbi:SUMF1/EgtB/PvdO family nonheme iron enzyme [Brevifollis gellanilyticus]|uniref:Uncharacterized protein n=1 Tax=Brevifollis gellanilyticus TaxID=748831 RepID=A0A512MFX6_9BACT|nr:SUMF1/EgtB/PvdO family nonheme iron enzyme [Brevifollis gellanilyticus]GEP45637.1 hypothetical protein BGE01nite_49280 [Brevifollis gellanilyticus]
MKSHSLIAMLLLPLGLLAQETPEKSVRIITRDATTPAGEPRVALIMGVSEVGSPIFGSLPGIKQDLGRMKATLEAAQFEVHVVTEPTLVEAHKAIDDFGDRLLATKGVGLFYFSGHGGEYNGANYLIPKGARITKPVDVMQEAIAAKRVIGRMEGQGTRVNIIFLDCCRNDLTKSAGGPGLAVMQAQGTFIGFATASEMTAAASMNGSPYTTALCKFMTQPGLSISDMHTRVTSEVKTVTRAAGAEQTPFMNSGLSDLFYFMPGAADLPPPGAMPPVMPAGGGIAPVDVKISAFQLAPGVEMKFVHCDSGSFYLGSPNDEAGHGDDEAAGFVRLTKEFWIAQTECTQAQWQAVMGSNPSEFKGPNQPMNNVSYNDAMNFCLRMNAAVKPKDGWRVSLPTEAQWEYACRAGTQSAFSFDASWADLWMHGNYADKSYTQFTHGDKTHSDGVGNSTAAVATYRPNAWGLYDMHGNVWEWCVHPYYKQQVVGDDPWGTANVASMNRVMRGGSWMTTYDKCRSASRSPGPAETRRNSIGFRVVLVKG